jgi:peptide/nickel transport system ATP-binding protein
MSDDEHSLADEEITTVMAGSGSTGRAEAAADRDGTDGTDSDGTDGTDSDGTDGTDSDGTDGTDSDGTDSAGA